MSDLRIVKGNDFATLYTIRAMYADGTIVEDFDLRVCTDVQVIVHRTYSKSVASLLSANEYGSYSLEPENVLRINWDGLLVKLGTYTVDFRAKFRGADIRSYSIKDLIFDIVETNEEANIPAGAFVDNGVYVFSGDFVLMFESQVQADWDEADTDSPAYIKNKPTIPDEVTEQTVADWGFTKNTGDYTKPEGGIPLSDLDAGVQSSLEKADTAYQLPSGGVPYDELSQSVQESLDKADTAYQKPPTGIPASDIASGVIPDVSQFITRSVDDLVNYYLKSETYTKTEVQGLIAAINQFHYEIYPSTSAVTNPQGNVLYLIGPTGTGADKYDEYVYTNNTWVKIGDTSIDLSGYVTTQALNSALASYSTTSQMNNAIAAALANYTTTANLNTLLAGKQDVLTFDNVPTDGSSNPVKSGGVYNVINSLKSAGYVFAGVATTSTNPGTPDYNVAYIGGAGTYANFGTSVTVPVGSICVFKYSGSWTKEQIKMFDGIDDAPIFGSSKLIQSGSVYLIKKELEHLIGGENTPNADLDIADGNGYVLSRFSTGNIETKKFNSRTTPKVIDFSNEADLEISDPNGNVILSLSDGNIKVKNFNSANIQGVSVARNTIWSWWTYPFAILTQYSFRGKLIWGYCDKEMNIGVCERDEFGIAINKTVVSKAEQADDHNAPAVFELPNGHIAVVYSKGHNASDGVFYRISQNIGDISVFGAETKIPTPNSEKTAYVQVFNVNGTYCIFTRLDSLDWAITTSSDFVTWSTMHIFLDADVQYYIKCAKVTDQPNVIRFAMYSNPDVDYETGIRIGYINFSTGNIYSGSIDQSNIVGTLNGSAISSSNFSIIIPATGYPSRNRLLDLAESPLAKVLVAYAQFTNTDTDDGEYYLYDTGTNINICPCGEAFYTWKYQGGISFIDINNIIISRNADGYDIIELWANNSGIWQKNEVLRREKTGSIPVRNIRPISDGKQEFVIWQRGYYDNTDYHNFDMDTIVKSINSKIK